MGFRILAAMLGAWIAVFVCGCTTQLKVNRYFDQNNLPTAGAPYSLSFTQYEITVTRRLTQCSSKGNPDDPDPDKREPKPIDLQVGVQVEMKSTEARDPMRNYVIDLESLNSFFKTTSATVAYYDSGAIKSLNASAEDKTGEFVASVVGIASKLIGAGVTGPMLLGAKRTRGCTNEIQQKLLDLNSLQAKITERTSRIDALSSELIKLNTVLGAAAKDITSSPARAQLGKLTVQLVEQMSKLAAETRASRPLLDAVSESKTFKWPLDGETFWTTSPVIPNLDRELYRSWINDKGMPKDTETQGDTDLYNQLAAKSAIYLILQPVDTFGRNEPCGKTCSDDLESGFKYRLPAYGRLLVCPDKNCHNDNIFHKGDVEMISQLGHVYALPLKSAMFSTKAVSATFAENGTPTSLGVTSTAASDKAATTFSALADLATTAHKTRAEQELNDLKVKTDLLKAKKDYADATAALQPAPAQTKLDATNAFKIDTDLVNANLAYIAAKKALDEAKGTLAVTQ